MPFSNAAQLFGGFSIITFCSLTALFGIAYVVHQSLWHPLAKYPGPIWAKLSGSYTAFHVYWGDNHTNTYKLHQKYGRIVRIGPNSLSFRSAQALKDIYGHGSTMLKDDDFYSAFSANPNLYNTHNSTRKAEHARKRRVLSSAFSETALKGMESIMVKNTQSFCGYLESLQGPKDMAKWFNYLTYDIMGDLCFGKGFSLVTDEAGRYVVNLIDTATHASVIAGFYPPLRKLGLQKIFMRHLAKERWNFLMYAREQADRRMSQEVDYQRGFFFYLLRSKDPETGEGFAPPELWEEAAMLMVAGSDTTSTALAATTYYLARDPECMALAVKEVRETFTSLDEILHGPKLSGCIYVRNCIDEALRLIPPVPGILPRQTMHNGTMIDGERLPRGICVGTPCFALHRDETYYPSPMEFRPTRWSDDSPAQIEKAKSAYAPFSIGPRGCIGKGLALMESRIAIARILFLYDVKTTGPLSEHYDVQDHFTAQKVGPLLTFVKRGSA